MGEEGLRKHLDGDFCLPQGSLRLGVPRLPWGRSSLVPSLAWAFWGWGSSGLLSLQCS